MEINLDHLSEDELRILNREIVKRLDFYSSTRQKMQLLEFRIGDRVEFDTVHEVILGRILRINQKTASIEADDGRYWRVAPGFLQRSTAPAKKSVAQKNIILFPTKNSHF